MFLRRVVISRSSRLRVRTGHFLLLVASFHRLLRVEALTRSSCDAWNCGMQRKGVMSISNEGSPVGDVPACGACWLSRMREESDLYCAGSAAPLEREKEEEEEEEGEDEDCSTGTG